MNALVIRKNWKTVFYATQVAVLMSACFLVTILYSVAWDITRNYPYAVEYEGHVFWAVLKLSQGANIYDLNALTSLPCSVMIYSPVYMLVGAALVKLLGATYWPLRVLTMASTLMCFWGLFNILDRSKLREFHSIIGTCLFASCLPVLYWSGVIRVDMFGLTLAIWGTERFVKSWLSSEKQLWSSHKPSISSLILFIFAFFTKQQYFVFPLACALFYFIKGQKRSGLAFLIAWTVPTLILSLAIQMVTGGYWAHLSYAAGLPWEWETLELFLVPFLTDWKTIASVFVILIGSTLSKRKATMEELPMLLLAISFGLALYTMGLRAAYHNHLLCTEFALFWLVALNLSRLSSGFSAIAILSVVFSLTGTMTYFGVLSERLRLASETKETMSLLEDAQLKGKPILTEDPLLAMSVDACPHLIDGTTIMNMSRRHPKQLEQLICSIEKKEFPVIIINREDAEKGTEQIWPRSVVASIKKNYRLKRRSGGNGIEQSVFFPIAR